MFVREVSVKDLEDMGYIPNDRREALNNLLKNVTAALRERIIYHTKDIAKTLSEIQIDVVGDSIRMTFPDRFKYIEEGTRPRAMISHVGKRIPLEDEFGYINVRYVSPEAVAMGKWFNPGISGSHFIADAINEAIFRTIEEGL